MLRVKLKMLQILEFSLNSTNDLDGLIHLTDISWEESGEDAIKKFKVDDLIKFKILEIDLDKERVSLGIKQLTNEPEKSENSTNKIVTCIVEKIDKDKITVKFDEDKKGFIKKSNLAKLKSEQNTERFAEKEKIDAKVIKKNKEDLFELSVKHLEIQEEKEALKEYGSSSSGASIGDIIGAALDENTKKKPEDLENEKK